MSRECRGHDWQAWETRKAAAEALDEKFKAQDCDPARKEAYWTIKTLRNALAHGTPPQDKRFRKLLASPERLHEALQAAIDQLLQ